MKTKNFIIWALLILAGIGFIYFFGIKQTQYTELGWVPFALLDNQHTNLVLNSGGLATAKTDFWDITTNMDVNYHYLSLTGGDAKPIISISNSEAKIKLKEDLKSKNFRVDYSVYCGGRDASSGNIEFNIKGASLNKIINYNSKQEGRIELIPSVLNESKSTLIIDGLDRGKIDTSNGAFFTATLTSSQGCELTLINPRWKPLFSCFIDNDEVLVFDDIKTNFNINNLAYPVQKFCINNPVVVRSFDERGLAQDTQSEIYTILSEGGTINVKENQVIRVPYITKVQGAVQRCLYKQAWNTETKKCENILSEGLPEPNQTSTIPIILGDNEFSSLQTYNSPDFYIGDLLIKSTVPTYNGDCNIGYTNSPNSNFKIKINGIDIMSGETVKLNDYIDVTYTPTNTRMYKGDYTNKQGELTNYNCEFISQEDWQNLLTFKINRDGLKISTEDDIRDIVKNNNKVNIIIDNKISSFTSSGFMIKTTKKIIDLVEGDYLAYPFAKGSNSYSIPLTTNSLGDINTEIIPYIEIEGKKIFSKEELSINYNIVKDSSNNNIINIVNVTGITNEVKIQKVSYIPDYISYLIYGFGIIIVILLILIAKNSLFKKKR